MLTLSLECLSSSCILCAQCWHCLSSVYLHPVSCVPNVDSVSRLFIFILYLVYPIFTQSRDTVNIGYTRYRIDCLSSSCILCTQCWQRLSIVCLHPVSCVPNVDIVYRLFIFILYLVYPMLTVSLDCVSSSCILCAQCWHCLSSCYLHPVSCVPNVDIVSRLFIFICILCTQCWQRLSIVCLHPVSLCTQCWQCLSIIYLHPVSCVPNVDIVSRVFIFILYLVCPMLTVSLDCLSSSCILCTQCWQCLSIVYLHLYLVYPMLTVSLDCLSSSCILCAQCWHCLSIVCLHPVSCVPNVDSVSRLFIFILYLVYPMLTVSLDCLSSSCILCAQCWHCLSSVYLHPVSCVPNVDSVSRLFIFILYLVYPMLTQSRDTVNIGYTRYRMKINTRETMSTLGTQDTWSIVYLHPVSFVPNVDIVSRLFIFIMYLVCPMLTLSLECLSSSCILCTQCWQCLSIVYLHPVSCVPNVDIVSRLFIFILYLVSQCWQCLSMVCLHPVSCVPNVDSVSQLFVFILYLVYPMLALSLDCLYSSCILCTQCWHNRETLSTLGTQDTGWRQTIENAVNIGYTRYRMKKNNRETLSTLGTQDTGWRQTIERRCQHWVHKIQDRLFIFILYLVCPMLTLSLECLSSSCILCAQCWHCLSIVYLHPVSCVPNVDSVSRLFVFILYLVYPMLTASLDCFSSSCILCTQCWQRSRLFVFILYLVYPMLTVSLDCLSSSCILCSNVDSVSRVFIFILYLVSQCWHCLSMVCLHPVSFVPNVDSVSRLFVFILYLVYPMLTLSLDCLSSSCILCTQCWQCLSIVYLHLYLVSPMLTLSLDCLSSSCILCTQCWQRLSIVCLHPVSCVPNVDSVSRLFIFILYLVCQMLTLSLECLSSSCKLCAQCWHCLSIVYLHPVSCVPNDDSVSRLFIFILYLVYPMLTVSLDCLSSSCILCTQCWHCLSIVIFILYLVYPMLTVSLDCLSSSCILCPNVDIVSRLFVFILYLVYPMLTVSLDYLSSSCILCAQCWHSLSSVYLHPVSCVPNVDIVSRLFIFILYLVYPMLTMSLDYLSSSCILCAKCWHCLSSVYLHLYLVCPMLTLSLDCLSSSCILCTQCWRVSRVVYLHPVSYVPNVDSVSRLFIFLLYLVYPMLTLSLDCLSSSCILCTQCWHNRETLSTLGTQDTGSMFIFILYLVSRMLTLSLDWLSSSSILCTQCWQRLSIVCLHPVSCVPNVDGVSRLFIFILYLVCPMLTFSLECLSSSCILCAQCWHCLSIVYLHPVSCVPNVDSVSEDKQSRDNVNIGHTRYRIDCLSSSCILCAQCWHCLSIVYLHPVSCVPNVDIVSRLFIFILYLVYPMLTVSLDCLSSSCILCAQCWHCLSIVYLHPVSCVPNVDIVSRLFIFILYLVYPMLTVSLDCLSSSSILCA